MGWWKCSENIESGNGYRTLWMYLMPLHCLPKCDLKILKMVILFYVYFTTTEFIFKEHKRKLHIKNCLQLKYTRESYEKIDITVTKLIEKEKRRKEGTQDKTLITNQYKLILIWGFVSLKCKWNFEVKIFHNFSHSFYNFTLLN